MTIEERALALWDELQGTPTKGDDLAAIADAIRRAVEEECDECARIVLAGGDDADRLETAIAHGTNAAIAEAILARKLSRVTPATSEKR